jgi:hypothetical protein
LALEGLEEPERVELESLVANPNSAAMHRVRVLYEKANVFEKASRLVDKYRERAEAVADDIQPDELRRLFYYLVDTVLDRQTPDEATPQVVQPTLNVVASA